jgi:hypothetical protein
MDLNNLKQVFLSVKMSSHVRPGFAPIAPRLLPPKNKCPP